ncbi:hypothetical protein [Actinomadura sp. DC4]|uniref:hypothetical protein n=1 Tax=Actinomadura sp. DC4 TaxID=3055069 RepID=UPI0025B20EBC|nr:hypothetical protein [Actinomadura sp. DC4]MDN3357084.1 hypothetical protein [Actinomadura sp. DC4]
MASELTRIAASLRRSPVYVTPSMASALPAPERLLQAIRSAPVPVFAVIVPLVAGGAWPDAEHLADAVHGRMRRDGVYLTLDEGSSNEIAAREYGVDRDSIDAAGAVNLDPAMDSASLTDRLTRCVELITSGRAHAVYQEQSDALDRRIRNESPGGGGHSLAYGLGGGAAVAVAAVAGLLVWRQRRVPRPRPALTGARTTAELRERAEAELVRLGEALEDKPDDTPGLREALDAYSAAGKALDAARTVPDLAGVLVLVDMGGDAAGGQEPTPLCFFNPLHGDGPVAVRWRAVGGRERLTVRACGACARAVRARKTPDVLRDGATPYYEVDPARSVWATTGYGQIRGDLVQRVLRGDLRRA